MRIGGISILLACLVLLSLESTAHAAMAKLTYPGKPPKRIRNLKWNDIPATREIEVEPEFIEEKGKRAFRGVVHLKAKLANHSGWIVVKGDTKLETSEKDGILRFNVDVPITGSEAYLHLFAISQEGQIEEENMTIRFAGWAAFKKLHTEGPPPGSAFSFVPSLGYTSIAYRETDVPDFYETALTLKFTATYRFKPSWDVGITPYLTLVPISTNQDGITARFLGANFRVGYVIPFVKEPWKLSLLGGVYYTTTFVTDSAFGFKNLMGPQIFPVLRRLITPRSSIGAYLKFSPVGSGLWISNLTDREIAGGASFTWMYGSPSHEGGSLTPLSISVDASNLAIQIDDTSISSTSVSLSFGMGL